MATIKDAARMCKRILLSNLLTDDDSFAVTPLVSGKHGIGKSQIAKKIAKDIGGLCFTVEGGSLKEGEITGIPYQYKKENEETEFRFLPYYVIRRIQNAEELLADKKEKNNTVQDVLKGEENAFSDEKLSFEEKAAKLKNREVTPVIIFFDEINRTDNAVFRELMNIILTRSVNGYHLPWWVFIMAAMNPSTQNSIYATNEMDPAQTDRFIKIIVREDAEEWLDYAAESGIDRTIMEFLINHPKALCNNDASYEDDELPMPTPRGWSMVDLILKSKNKLDGFFTKEELIKEEKDTMAIMAAKVGSDAAAMYRTSLTDNSKLVLAEDVLNKEYDTIPPNIRQLIIAQSTARNTLTSKNLVRYLVDNIDQDRQNAATMDHIGSRLKEYMSLLDDSSRLLFAVSITNAYSKKGISVFDHVYEIFDEALIDLIQVSNLNEMRLMGDI